jgi:hypothetical protein
MIRSRFEWCPAHDLDPLAARRAHVERWQRTLEQHGYALRTIALKLTAVASFYRYCEQDLVARSPMAFVDLGWSACRRAARSTVARSMTCSPLPSGSVPSLRVVLHVGLERAAHRGSDYTHGRDQALRATTHSVAAYVPSTA